MMSVLVNVTSERWADVLLSVMHAPEVDVIMDRKKPAEQYSSCSLSRTNLREWQLRNTPPAERIGEIKVYPTLIAALAQSFIEGLPYIVTIYNKL